MASNRDFWQRFKPGVEKVWLYLAAGLMWFGVGIMLIRFANRWLALASDATLVLLILAGVTLAAGIYGFGFSRLAKKNIRRISLMDGERTCFFAFQEWKSYPLVIFMIGLGIYLRLYAPIPKTLLAALYIGIGGGLSSSSLHYFVQVFRSLGVEFFGI